jgi:outer membrane protein OmpA-like peptidoglycan-associated protein
MALPLAAPLAAHAQAVTGPYVSLEAGTSIQSSFNYQYWHGQGPSGHFNTRPSWAGVAGVGYGFGNGFRVQLDGNFERNTVHSLSADYYFGSYHARAFGGLDTYGPMLNALYDINVGLPVFPYVGAGVGYQWMGMDKRVYDTSYRDYDSGTRGSFAYDVIAGLSYPLPMVPGLSLTAEYRFKQQVESRNYYADCCGPTPPVNGTSENPLHIGQISSHTFLVGLRYQIFNPPPAPVAAAPAPAPAPMAAPAPAPARTFLVFFDWDKSDLTPRATQIIAEAASDSKSSSVTTLDVSGYTDTSGTPDYNQGLSQRRAEAVAGQLETDGVPTAEIEIHAYGETHLLVPTGPGVREPQNRRVEIVLQ